MKSWLVLLLSTVLLSGMGKVTAQTDGKPAAAKGKSAVAVKNIDAHEAAKLLQENQHIVVLDVRTPEEFTAGHIAGAKNIDFHGPDFEKKLSALEKKQPYLVHCAAGGRSAKARELMKKLQFQTIYHLEGGLKAWEKAGQPVVR